MANYTPNLNLRLPLGSKYWNLDTHNENMAKLDGAYPEVHRHVFENLNASRIAVSNQKLEAENMQEAVDELLERESSLHYMTITEDTTLRVRAEGHTYFVLTFGEFVPVVSFLKYPMTATSNLSWLNGPPVFEPNSVFEVSILKMSGIWYKRDDFDYSRFFEYYIENNICYITRVKASDWHAYFGNYDVIIPSTLLGYPVMLDGYHT